MKLIKFIAAAAVATAFANPASAAILGAADLNITQLLLLSNAPGTLAQRVLTPAQINLQNESRTGNSSADYNGVSISTGNQTIFTIGGALDLPASVVGPDAANVNGYYGGNAQNNLGTHLTTPPGNFALSDMFISGSAVTASGAAGLTRANASLATGPGAGGANTTISNNVTANLTFAVTETISAQFAIGYDLFVKAWVGPNVPATKGIATFGTTYSLNLRESTPIVPNTPPVPTVNKLSFSPEELNQGAISNTTATNVELSQQGMLFTNFVTLIPGKVYSLAISQSSSASVTQGAADIPEPGTLFLSALGLLAVGAGARRRLK